MPRNLILIALPLLMTAACSGTGAQHQPVLSATAEPGYEQDLSACRDLAKSQGLWNPETQTQAALGAAIGALAGAADGTGDSTGNVLAGALVGGVTGAGAGALDMRDTRKDILLQCLRDRGHPVAG